MLDFRVLRLYECRHYLDAGRRRYVGWPILAVKQGAFMESRPRIMIVDDDPDLVHLLEAALRDTYETVSTTESVEALACANEYEPDLFIIDIMMPVMSGWELIERLRADFRHRSRPIVVLTAKDTRSDIKRGYELGANLYLTKPLSLERLHKNLEVFRRGHELECHPKTLSIEEIREQEALRRKREAAKAAALLVLEPPPKPAPAVAQAPKAVAKAVSKPAVKPDAKPIAQPGEPEAPPEEEIEEPPDPFSTVDHLFDPSSRKKPPEPAKEEEEPVGAAGPLDAAGPSASAGPVPRVLVADDDDDILAISRDLLGARYELLVVHDGLEAIQKAKQYKPDVFVIDGMMPRMSGYQVCDALHSFEDFRNSPIIFMSVKASSKDVRYAKTLRISRFLPKPFDPEDLLEAIAAITSDSSFRVRSDRPTWKEVMLLERQFVSRERERHHVSKDLSDSRRALSTAITAIKKSEEKPGQPLR